MLINQMRIVISYAQSIDGRIATATGDSKWISGPESLRLAHELRRDCDAILVGVGTVVRDDPQLSCRLAEGVDRQPLRVILDPQLRTPPTAKVVQTQNLQPTLIIHAADLDQAAQSRRSALVDLGVATRPCPENNGHLSVAAVVRECSDQGVQNLFVEGGARVITSFIRARAFDELWVVCSPLIIGQGTEAVGDLGISELREALRLEPYELTQLGTDLVWKLRLSR